MATKLKWLGTPTCAPSLHRSPVSIPEDFTEQSLLKKLASYYIKGEGQSQERFFYLQEAYKRFLYSLELVPNQSGSLLEIGSNPYFMTLLLQWFRDYDLTLINYFGTEFEKHDVQIVIDSNGAEIPFEFDNINIEEEASALQLKTVLMLFCCVKFWSISRLIHSMRFWG